jgi:uncharacterized protein (DUF1330 family)
MMKYPFAKHGGGFTERPGNSGSSHLQEETCDLEPQLHIASHVVASLTIGAVLTTALQAQSTPPAHVVAEVAIHDSDAFMRDNAAKMARTLEPYFGRFLTSGKLTALEGNVPQRFVIIAFDSVERARGLYDSPAYQQLLSIRQKTATSTLFIAEGHRI